MTLPALPRVIKKREAKVTPRVLQWFRDNYKGSCAMEIKSTDTESIHSSALKPHQRLALWDVSMRGGVVHKLSDEARRKQPFDAVCLKGCPGYVVACFSRAGICKVIRVENWSGATLETVADFDINL